MSRHSFGAEGEPGSMQVYLELLSDADSRITAVQFAVPGDVQTLEYAAAVLGRWEPPRSTQIRAQNRVNRGHTLIDDGVALTVITSAAALLNEHVVGGNRSALLGQLVHLERLVQYDTQRLRIGIVPASVVPLLPNQMPADITFISPNDLGVVETPGGAYIHGPEAFTIDSFDTQGPRSEVVDQRQVLLRQWMGSAVFGAGALAIVRTSRELLETA